ncbi:hypothetical protein SeMB42_g06301 [Synchytrium endobioticum]|uniref:Uncharacterized protein n=1 Tax=Synchytrium endobioticum TaxID=286115 RepID=A0A507CLT5_9FUNG|nr:hypothetical protein SeLEV6574_g07741 [Synchytrium endobioticum]TPX39634.1 hypothetical protein SeMB42_g06301 [Synchytrium endobioticum]
MKLPFPKSIFLALILDFDETITSRDTISYIANLSYTLHPTTPPWSYFTSAYMNDYNHVQPDPSTLESYISSFTTIEKASLERVNARKVLSGIPQAALSNSPTDLQAPHYRHFMNAFKATHAAAVCRVVSLNWSKDLISGVSGFDKQDVVSNDLEFVDGVSTGVVTGAMYTGIEKLEAAKAAVPAFGVVEGYGIAVGDAVSDLPLLLTAGLGLVINPRASFYNVCSRFNIHVAPISSRTALDGVDRKRVVYSVTGWEEIHRVLLGVEMGDTSGTRRTPDAAETLFGWV